MSFEGETGPYLQYAVVRANNIFNKLQEREGLSERATCWPGSASLEHRRILTAAGGESDPHDLWALVFESARLDEIVDQTIRALEFSVLAKYAFGLAQLFNAFYHRYPILNEEDPARRRWRAAGVAHFRSQTDASPRSDGHRSSDPDVTMAHIAITACQRLEDYKQAILHTGGEVHIVDAIDERRRSAGRASTVCC